MKRKIAWAVPKLNGGEDIFFSKVEAQRAEIYLWFAQQVMDKCGTTNPSEEYEIQHVISAIFDNSGLFADILKRAANAADRIYKEKENAKS